MLWYSRNKSKVDGEVFLLYLILYSVARLFIEGLRTDSLMWGGPIRVAQLISIIGIIIPAAILYNKKNNFKCRFILKDRKKTSCLFFICQKNGELVE